MGRDSCVSTCPGLGLDAARTVGSWGAGSLSSVGDPEGRICEVGPASLRRDPVLVCPTPRPRPSGALTARVDFLGNPQASRSQLLRAASLEAPTLVTDAPTSRGLTPGRGGGRRSRAWCFVLQNPAGVIGSLGPLPRRPCLRGAGTCGLGGAAGPVPADRPRRLRAHTGGTALRCGHVPAGAVPSTRPGLQAVRGWGRPLV